MEYSRSGAVVKGAEKPVVRSKYAEDVYINNHTVSRGNLFLFTIINLVRALCSQPFQNSIPSFKNSVDPDQRASLEAS